MTDVGRTPAKSVGVKAERRNLTVLFGDVVGSSALATQLDPEDLREVLRSVQAAFRDAIGRYDGHIARYLGDGVLAYFGFPVAHEDDAERAVNAGLQMIASVSALSFPRIPPPKLHIGIATGLVVVGDLIGEGPSREFELIGEAPNLAAWLQQQAGPNQILVSPTTRRLLGETFEVEDVGERTAKGHKEPLRVWSVLRRSAVQSRFDARRSARLARFVGREVELAALCEQYEKAKSGQGRLVSISGEPGIGKSRLIAALRERLAGEAHRTSLFQCSSYHTSSPWYPVIRHLEDAAGIAHDSPPPAKLQVLEELVDQRLPGRREEVVPLLAALLSIPTGERYPPLELTPPQLKRRTLAALRDLLCAGSGQAPVIPIFEDIHWIDPSSLELLELLRKAVKERRVLIIASYRPEFDPPWTDDADAVSIFVNPLDAAHAARLVESLTEGRAWPASLVEQVVAKTDGVPLFVEEVTEAVRQGISVDGGPSPTGWQSIPAVPDTLQDSLMARLDRLAPMKAVAQMSSAIGREFSLDLLEAAAPLPRDEIHAAIDRLAAAGIVLRGERRAAETCIFKHALVQDAAYSSMLRDERRKLHIRIAEALCQKFGEIAESAPELVAHHYTRAQETKLAASYWFKAGGQAGRRSAFVEALTHFRSALELLLQLPESAERDEVELQLQQALAGAFIAVKGFGAPETMHTYERALALCEKYPGTPHIFAVLNGLVGVHYLRGDFEQSRAVAEDLLARAVRQTDTTPVLVGHRVLGMSLFVTGELEEARTQLQKAIDLYDPERHARYAVAFSQDFKATAEVYLGLATVLAGDAEKGVAHSRAALAYAEKLRHPHSICYVLPFFAGTLIVADMPEEAHAVAERAVALSAEYGFPQWAAGGVLLRGWARIEMGELESGVADVRNSIAGLEAAGTLIWKQFGELLLAQGLAKAGEAQEAETLVDRILAEMQATGGRWYEAETHRLKGDLLLAARRPISEVEARYEAARTIAARQGARLFQGRAEEALAALRRSCGGAAEVTAKAQR
ncbi:MAG: AAA family ATPase [Propylenella sp.]